MEVLDEVKWDAVIVGTGIYESLLALALSKSDRKILHIDRNGYYGSAEAALNLEDILKWTQSVRNGAESPTFLDAECTFEDLNNRKPNKCIKPGNYRAYSLAFAPQIIPCKSALLQTLVSSRSEDYVEFLAVGNAWILDPDIVNGSLHKVPNTREDLFSDAALGVREKRALTRFLHYLTNSKSERAVWEIHAHESLTAFLHDKFKLPAIAQKMILTLLNTHFPPQTITVGWAIPRLTIFMESMNTLGPGFAFIVPKWGGLSEVAQAGCRACAVGGGVYMLNTAISQWKFVDNEYEVHLGQGLIIRTKHLVGSDYSFRSKSPSNATPVDGYETAVILHKAIYIIDAPLDMLFGSGSEDQKRSAAVVVSWLPDPAGGVPGPEPKHSYLNETPVVLLVHSSATGECPPGQSVVYASKVGADGESGKHIETSISRMLNEVYENNAPSVLFSLKYQQLTDDIFIQGSGTTSKSEAGIKEGPFLFPSTMTNDPVFDDKVFSEVKQAWGSIVDPEYDDQFMQFNLR